MFAIFFIFSKFCSNFFILGFLFIFFPNFFFKFLTQMLVSKSFCSGIFVFFFLSHKSLFQFFFVQNVFLKILFPNFYSNFFFSIFGIHNIFGQKILIQTFAILFVSSNFSFSQSFVCLIFFLQFLLCHKFWFQFFIQNLFGIFLDKKLIQTFTLSLFLI